MLFFLPSGHVLKMIGIQAGTSLLSLLLYLEFRPLLHELVIKYFIIFLWTLFCQIFMFCTRGAELKGIRKSYENQQRYDSAVCILDKLNLHVMFEIREWSDK
jgi:hypothetical protein